MVSNKHLEVEQQINLSGHTWHVSCLDFSSNGLYLASGSWDKTIRIWDLSLLETSIVLGTGENGHEAPVTSLSWLPDVEFLLVSGSADNTAAVWNMDNGSKLATFTQHFGWVLGTSIAPQGGRLCTASWDKTLHIIDLKSCQVVSKLQGHTEGVWNCDFATNMLDVLCSSSDDGSVKVWDTRVDNKWTTAKTLIGAHEDGVLSCSWSPCGTYIAAGSRDHKISIWDIRQNKLINFVEGHEDAVTDLSLFEMYGDSILMASAGDVSCRFWQPLSRNNVQLSCLKYHDDGFEVECLAISPDKTLLATGGRDNKLMLSALKLDTLDIELKRISEVDALLDGRGAVVSSKNGSSAAIVDHAVLRSDLLQKQKRSIAAKQTIKIKVKPTSDLLQTKLMQLKPNNATVEERGSTSSNAAAEHVKDQISQLRKVDDPTIKSPNLETTDNARKLSAELETRRKTLRAVSSSEPSPDLPNYRPTAEAEGSMRYKSKELLGERTRLRHVETIYPAQDEIRKNINNGEVFFHGNDAISSRSSSLSSGTVDSRRDSTLDKEMNGVVTDMFNMSEEDLIGAESRPNPKQNNWSYDAQL